MLRSKLPDVGLSIFSKMSQLAAEHGAVNLSQGFPSFECDARLFDLVHHHMRAGHNQYAPMTGVAALRQLIAHKATTLYDCRLDADAHINITAGATQAIFTIISTVVRSGDEVLVIDPAFDCYRPAIALQGAVVVPYALTAPDFRIDWEAFGRLITPRTRLIILNTPHNPTGMVMNAEDMWALAHLVADTDILLLSDEVYEHMVFDGRPHESVLRYPELWDRSFAVFSMGKTFHVTGWKVGYCVAPERLMREFRKVHQYNVFSVNTPVQYALADYMKDPSTWQGISGMYEQKRDYFKAQLQDSALTALACEGTYFVLIDYSALSDKPDVEFAEWLTREIGVAAIPISVFYGDRRDDRILRFCFAKTPQELHAAGQRLSKLHS